MTFAGLAGMGDLITTCVSPHSRNRHVGEQLGQRAQAGRHPRRDEHGRRGRQDGDDRARRWPSATASRCPCARRSTRSSTGAERGRAYSGLRLRPGPRERTRLTAPPRPSGEDPCQSAIWGDPVSGPGTQLPQKAVERRASRRRHSRPAASASCSSRSSLDASEATSTPALDPCAQRRRPARQVRRIRADRSRRRRRQVVVGDDVVAGCGPNRRRDPAIVALARTPADPCAPRAGPGWRAARAVEQLLDRRRFVGGQQSPDARADLGDGLVAAKRQRRQHEQLAARQPPALVGAVAIAGRPSAVRRVHEADEPEQTSATATPPRRCGRRSRRPAAGSSSGCRRAAGRSASTDSSPGTAASFSIRAARARTSASVSAMRSLSRRRSPTSGARVRPAGRSPRRARRSR